MSTKVKFGNKKIQLPGSYSRIVSGQNNPPSDLDYGKLLIIDSNKNGALSDQNIMGGAGVNGELSQGNNSLYRFTDINSFKEFVGRGWWYKAAQYLFNPDGNGNGVSEVIIVKPSTTTAANMTFSTISGTNGGTFKIKTKDESEGSNGVLNASSLSTPEVVATTILTFDNNGVAGDQFYVTIGNLTLFNLENDSGISLANFIIQAANYITLYSPFVVQSYNATTIHIAGKPGTGDSLNGATVNTYKFTPGSTGYIEDAFLTAPAMSGGVNATYDSATAELLSGYAYSIESGKINTSKWVFKLWKGTYRGLYSDGISYDGILEGQSKPDLIAQSPEFNNIQDLIDWGNSDSNFGSKFAIDTVNTHVHGTGVVIAGDVALVPGYNAAVGSTETFDSMDDTLEVIKELNYNYVMMTSDAKDCSADTDILKIFNHIKIDAKYDKFFIHGIKDSNSKAEARTLAVNFDSQKVNLVFDSILERSNLISSGFRTWDSFYHSCVVVGRLLGLAPEVPLTFKTLAIDGVKTPLNERDKELFDEAGVICTVYDDDFKKFICLHDVNTLQDNDFVLTNLGLSHLIQIERIKSQLNKELIINSKLDLLSDPSGVNRNSLSKTVAVEWTKTYLKRKVGTLIIEWRNVTATIEGDAIFVDYEAMPNSEIKGIFFTGRIYL